MKLIISTATFLVALAEWQGDDLSTLKLAIATVSLLLTFWTKDGT